MDCNGSVFEKKHIKEQLDFFSRVYEWIRTALFGSNALPHTTMDKIKRRCNQKGMSLEVELSNAVEKSLVRLEKSKIEFIQRVEETPQCYPLGVIKKECKLKRHELHVFCCITAVALFGRREEFHVSKLNVRTVARLYYKSAMARLGGEQYFAEDNTLLREGIIEFERKFNQQRSTSLPEAKLALTSKYYYFVLGKGLNGKRHVKRQRPVTEPEEHHNNEVSQTKRATLGQIITPRVRLAEVVMTQENRTRVQKALSYIRNTELIFDTWGVEGRKGVALTLLIVGPPGTGKTFLSEAIAGELDSKMLLITGSDIVSLWHGETERSASQVFDKANRIGAVIVFDEADSFFNQRTHSLTGVDETMNRTVATLLHNIETCNNPVVLTTNRPDALDPAIDRRIAIKILMDLPKSPQRKLLWMEYVPTRMPCSEDVDIEELAREYPLTGSQIKNVVLRVARSLVYHLDSGNEGQVATMDNFKSACREELRGLEILGALPRPIGFCTQSDY